MPTRYTFEQYRSIFEEAIKKYEGDEFFARILKTHQRPVFPAAPRNCAVIGIRHEGKETKFRENTADDTVVLVRIAGDGARQVFEYVGTTESGLFDKVINAEGDFKMSPGFSYFKLGKHGKQSRDCLVQACDVIGERAKKGKGFDETDGKRWTVPATIHIHAGVKNVNNVADWSAGCTVIAGGWEGKAWAEFFGHCKNATNMPIPYVLVNESDIPELLEAAQASVAGASNGSNGSNGANASADAPQLVTADGRVIVAVAAPAGLATTPDEVREAAATTTTTIATPPPTVAPPTPTPTAAPSLTVAPPAAAGQGEVVQASTGSRKRMGATVVGVVVALVASVKGFMETNPVASALIIIGVVAAVVWLLSWYIHAQKDLDKKRMELAADPDKKTVR